MAASAAEAQAAAEDDELLDLLTRGNNPAQALADLASELGAMGTDLGILDAGPSGAGGGVSPAAAAGTDIGAASSALALTGTQIVKLQALRRRRREELKKAQDVLLKRLLATMTQEVRAGWGAAHARALGLEGKAGGWVGGSEGFLLVLYHSRKEC